MTKVDLYRYDDKWEREVSDALETFFGVDEVIASDKSPLTSSLAPKPGTSVIDLRQPSDFADAHLPGSINVPLVYQSSANPFTDAEALETLWLKFEELFKSPSTNLKSVPGDQQILLLCYDGDSSRVATSVLNFKGYKAENLKGGFGVLKGLNGVLRTEGAETVQLQTSTFLEKVENGVKSAAA